METLKFKTNIKCAACVAKVSSSLNETAGENQWTVDIQNPAKILTVNSNLDAAAIKEAVEKAGYKAESIAE